MKQLHPGLDYSDSLHVVLHCTRLQVKTADRTVTQLHFILLYVKRIAKQIHPGLNYSDPLYVVLHCTVPLQSACIDRKNPEKISII